MRAGGPGWRALLVGAGVALSALQPGLLATQEPPDSLPPDTTQEVPDSLQQAADSAQETPDSLVFHELPEVPGGRPAGWDRGTWVWDREDLLGSRALTLAELLALAPGVIPVLGGDYGAPSAVTAFGLTAGRLRVFLDGFEIVPLDGGVADLARIGLGGLESVRLERGPGELRVELESYRVDDPRPVSFIEAGTGDLRTNHFRGTFVHPRALGGSLGLDVERLDTRGPQGLEPGALSGGWLRYSLHRGDAAGLRLEYRLQGADIDLPQEADPEGGVYPGSLSRQDWVVRGRARLAEGLVAEAFTGVSSVDGGTEDGLTPIEGRRRQHGLRVGYERGSVWGRSSWRTLSGPDLPSSGLELEAGGGWPGVAGASARWSREVWGGRAVSLRTVSVWTEPFYGLSAFAGWEDGMRGGRFFPVRVPVEDPDEPGEEEPPPEEPEPEEPEPEAPSHGFTERTGYRVGATARVGPLTASAARVWFETDSLQPFGLLLDRGMPPVAGGRFTGLEAWARLRLPVQGFALQGSLQRWDRGGLYLPALVYAGGLEYHDQPMASGNLEVWGSLGVTGRDPMVVPGIGEDGITPAPQEVPFFQSWNAFVQVRIVTVRIFIRFDNFTLRRANQDVPGRILPATRATYGVRWTLWN